MITALVLINAAIVIYGAYLVIKVYRLQVENEIMHRKLWDIRTAWDNIGKFQVEKMIAEIEQTEKGEAHDN